ncbi:MAG: hypothetical protein AB8B63_16985 [Granulosicoccus sp.]
MIASRGQVQGRRGRRDFLVHRGSIATTRRFFNEKLFGAVEKINTRLFISVGMCAWLSG